ncbi:inositol 1,3,4-trisphosphate, partial [Reticulomyxa filosa]
VYVLGHHVFSTVNESIPPATNTEAPVYVLSRDLSKNLCKDQSSSNGLGELYQQLSQHLRKLFDFNCFGYDLIVDEKDSSKGYILDINYLPSYKSVDNFTSLFWGFALEQYYEFLNQKSS